MVLIQIQIRNAQITETVRIITADAIQITEIQSISALTEATEIPAAMNEMTAILVIMIQITEIQDDEVIAGATTTKTVTEEAAVLAQEISAEMIIILRIMAEEKTEITAAGKTILMNIEILAMADDESESFLNKNRC